MLVFVFAAKVRLFFIGCTFFRFFGYCFTTLPNRTRPSYVCNYYLYLFLLPFRPSTILENLFFDFLIVENCVTVPALGPLRFMMCDLAAMKPFSSPSSILPYLFFFEA